MVLLTYFAMVCVFPGRISAGAQAYLTEDRDLAPPRARILEPNRLQSDTTSNGIGVTVPTPSQYETSMPQWSVRELGANFT